MTRPPLWYWSMFALKTSLLSSSEDLPSAIIGVWAWFRFQSRQTTKVTTDRTKKPPMPTTQPMTMFLLWGERPPPELLFSLDSEAVGFAVVEAVEASSLEAEVFEGSDEWDEWAESVAEAADVGEESDWEEAEGLAESDDTADLVEE